MGIKKIIRNGISNSIRKRTLNACYARNVIIERLK